MKENKRKIIVSILGILSLLLITVGVTYAVFTYTKLGSTENTVTAGTLKFLYTENSGVGAGIKLTNALPVSDTVGKSYSTEGQVFDFKVESTNTGNEDIPYEVTLRKKSDSTLNESLVKIYLTDMTEGTDTEILEPTLYSKLTNTSIDVGNEVEKTLYKGTVAGGTTDYIKNFRLRMWVDENADFGNEENHGKTFTATVNVYANAKVVTEEEVVPENNTEISSATIGDTTFTKVEGQEYDYEATVEAGTKSISIETVNPNATVEIEKIDSLAYTETNIKRLATVQVFDLTEGDNFFKVTVTSESKEVTDEFKLKVTVEKSLGIAASTIISNNELITTEPTLTTTSYVSGDANGLYKSTETNSGDPTYYFRGNVTNNYVSFAGQTWRIVRINEDGTIRMIMQDGINSNKTYAFNATNYTTYPYMYYTNSEVKTSLETWYTGNLSSYSDKIATGDYFCEEAKVFIESGDTSGSATMTVYTSYIPNFKCSTDGNGKGIVNGSIGLITYDELVYAGGYYDMGNQYYYLNNRKVYNYWTMSPSGVTNVYGSDVSTAWYFLPSTLGKIWSSYVNESCSIRPVINLKADVTITGSGLVDDPYVVQ